MLGNKATNASIRPPSESDDRGFRANKMYMALPSETTPLRHTPCEGSNCDDSSLIREDFFLYILHGGDLKHGLPLRRTHRYMYQVLRPNKSCVALQRHRLGVSGTEGNVIVPFV